jgi:hypothetical protein
MGDDCSLLHALFGGERFDWALSQNFHCHLQSTPSMIDPRPSAPTSGMSKTTLVELSDCT